MNTPSHFQHGYPLSRKKFWKKMIQKVWAILAGGLALGVITGTFMSMLFLDLGREKTIISFFISCGIFSLVGIAVIAILYGTYVHAYILRYYYDVAEQFITIQKGVFAPTEIHVPYGKIQDIYVDQDVLDRILGIYDVHIASATSTSGIEAHIDGVDEPIAEALKNLLLQKIQLGPTNTPPAAPVIQVPVATPSVQQVFQGPQSGAFNTKTYPIDNKWIATAIFTNLGVAASWTFVFFATIARWGWMDYVLGFVQAALVFFVVFAFAMIWSLLWKSSFFFEFQPQYILLKDGVVSREEKHVPYRSVQNVLLKRSVIERLLGLSTVIIENAAMGSTKSGRASRVTLPGQPFEKGEALVTELNRILVSNGPTPTNQL